MKPEIQPEYTAQRRISLPVLLRSVRYLRPMQILWRVRCRLWRMAGGLPVPGCPPARHWNAAARLRVGELVAGARAAAAFGPTDLDALREGLVSFLNQAAPLEPEIPWQESRHGRLWQYNLHYCRFVRDGVAAGVIDGPTARRLLEDWVARNPPGTDVAWDPFCVAARLINWPLALVAVEDIGDTLRESYALQAAFLRRNLEWDVQANHLHKNAAARVVASALLDDGHAARDRRLLEDQLREQILPDGGHYERSVMYHLHVLEDTLIAGAIADLRFDAMEKMMAYLQGMCYEDGTYPLFGDAVLGDTTSPAALSAWATTQKVTPATPSVPRAYADAGFYWLGETGGLQCVVTAGEPQPAWQPGHAHADALSYELRSGEKTFVVDTGVHGYADSPHRAYCRGTAAHNVTRPQGAEQLELWGAFRVGRRYRLKVARWDASGVEQALAAEHDGYRPVGTERQFRYHASGVLLITDRFTSPRALALESFVHVHPMAAVKPDDEAFVIKRAGESLVLLLEHDTGARLAAGTTDDPLGFHFPRFGVIEDTHCLVLTKQGVRLRYAWVRCGSVREARAIVGNIKDEWPELHDF